jgi:hypothetical protein
MIYYWNVIWAAMLPSIELTLPGHCAIVCTLRKAFVAPSNDS